MAVVCFHEKTIECPHCGHKEDLRWNDIDGGWGEHECEGCGETLYVVTRIETEVETWAERQKFMKGGEPDDA